MQSWKRLYGWLISSKKKYPNFVVNGPSDLKLYSQFSSLQKSIQQAQQGAGNAQYGDPTETTSYFDINGPTTPWSHDGRDNRVD